MIKYEHRKLNYVIAEMLEQPRSTPLAKEQEIEEVQPEMPMHLVRYKFFEESSGDELDTLLDRLVKQKK